MSDALELKPISGQDFLVTDEALGAVKLIAYEGRINFRESVTTKERRYFYAPYLAFVKEAEGDDIDISVSDDVLPDGKVLIFLKIQWDRDDLPQIVRRYLIRQGFVDPTITNGQILPLSLKSLVIETSDNPKVTFFDQQEPNITSSTIPLRGTVNSRETAERLVRDLKRGDIGLVARFIFDGAAFQQNTIIIDVQDILNTISAKNLDGAGVKTVTRDQIADVSQEALRITKVKKQIEFAQDDVSELTAMLLATLTAEVKDLAGDLSKLTKEFMEFGFSPLDFRADLIRRSQTKQSNTFHQIFSDKLREVQKDDDTSFNLFTNFDDILDVDFADKDKYRDYARDIYSEAFSEKNADVSFEGEKIVPKSISIRRVDKTKLVVGSTITIKSSRFVGDAQPETLFMSVPDNVVHLKAGNTFEERLAKSVVPVGTLLPYAGDKAPDGWLLCNGDVIDVNMNPEYSVLAAILGKTYDPQQVDVRLPDLQGRVPVGTGMGKDLTPRTLGEIIGNESQKLEPKNINHSHNLPIAVSFTGGIIGITEESTHFSGYTGNVDNNNNSPNRVATSGANILSMNPTGGDRASRMSTGTPNLAGDVTPIGVIQPSLAVSYIIKY